LICFASIHNWLIYGIFHKTATLFIDGGLKQIKSIATYTANDVRKWMFVYRKGDEYGLRGKGQRYKGTKELCSLPIYRQE